ncbi:hypothetical protein OXX79_001839 [Metschnikowia pulcherrima]
MLIQCSHATKYIQLTVCPRCGKFADRYIEFDNVIIFLDLLLLRPQAYRHVAFNIVEESIFKSGTQGRFTKYRKLHCNSHADLRQTASDKSSCGGVFTWIPSDWVFTG